MTTSKGKKRISFEIPDDMHAALRILSRQRGLPMTNLVKLVVWENLSKKYPEYNDILKTVHEETPHA